MSRGWRRAFATLGLCVVFLIPGAATTQPAGQLSEIGPACAGGEDGLLAALDLNWDRQVAMMAERGFNPRSQARAVARWLEGLPEGAASLILVGEGPTHCGYLVDREGLKAFGVSRSTPAEVKALHAAWRAAANVDQTGSGRRGLGTADGRDGRRSRSQEADEALTAFSEALLPGPVRAGIPKYRRVLVLPYGDLGAAPYAALPLERGGPRFVDVSAVMVLPGVQLAKGKDGPWVNQRGEKACPAPVGEKTKALVVGDPANMVSASGEKMPPLPGARREAQAVAKIFGVAPVMSKAATLEAVKAQARNTSFIHLAAHGVALPDTPLQSYIALSDGRWTAGDIMQSCLQNVAVAVLSACQTGLGKTVDGGVIGLARAFYLAGVDDVVMTLWSVDDEATVMLMTVFSEEIAKGSLADEALRQAMLRTRKAYPEPINWAAFSVFGSSMLAEQSRRGR